MRDLSTFWHINHKMGFGQSGTRGVMLQGNVTISIGLMSVILSHFILLSTSTFSGEIINLVRQPPGLKSSNLQSLPPHMRS